jgi:hypothetical protein
MWIYDITKNRVELSIQNILPLRLKNNLNKKDFVFWVELAFNYLLNLEY